MLVSQLISYGGSRVLEEAVVMAVGDNGSLKMGCILQDHMPALVRLHCLD